MRIFTTASLVFISAFIALLGGAMQVQAYSSCVEVLKSGKVDSGTYNIDNLGDVYCDLTTNGGGWVAITPQIAKEKLGGVLEILSASSTSLGGMDGDRPHTRDGVGEHTAWYNITLPKVMKEFFFKDYIAKSNSAPGDSSDIYPSRFKQTEWNKAHGVSVGDIAFGFSTDSGPTTSFARKLGEDRLFTNGQMVGWPSPQEQYRSSNGGSTFRISWGDEGTPSEGWFPWWSGSIMVRDGDPFIKIKIDETTVERDQDVRISALVSGFSTDPDAKMTVEYEDNEGGSCDGNWKKAAIKSSIDATHDDVDGEPSKDNGATYQIGSASDHRIITTKGQNKITFTWDAEEDLGNDLNGDYCVRFTVRNDDGKSDSVTKILHFNQDRDDLKVRIRDVDVQSDNDVEIRSDISGDPENKDAKMQIEYEDNEGGSCDGNWEQAHIKGSARAENDDIDGNPDVDNGNTYQIGSENDTRVIANGTNNEIKFTWDAERDLGNDPKGRYCVRVKVRADSGESDTDTYIVNFGGVQQAGVVTVTSPINNVAITDINPTIQGTGVVGNNIVLSSSKGNCNAVVQSNGIWSCRLANLTPGTYSVIASQYKPNNTLNGTAAGSFMIVQTIANPAPVAGGLCEQHITSYMRVGTYNDQSQVRKLQEYLNTREGERLVVSGVFDAMTEQAVKRYQAKYAQDILYPWGMKAPSGYVYKTTINHINRQLCSGKVQCPVFTQYHRMGQSGGEIAKIQTFLRQYGYYNGASTGYFDRATDVGIKAFQEEFRPMVLTPWRLPLPTGNWYKTSRKHANWLNGCYERVTLEGMGVTF